MMNKVIVNSVFGVLFLAIGGFFAPVVLAATGFSLSPSSGSSLAESFSIGINADLGAGEVIDSASFNFIYDSDIASYQSVSSGALPCTATETSAGTVAVICNAGASDPVMDADGRLVTLNFTATATGNMNVDVSDVILADSGAQVAFSGLDQSSYTYSVSTGGDSGTLPDTGFTILDNALILGSGLVLAGLFTVKYGDQTVKYLGGKPLFEFRIRRRSG